MRGFCSLLPLLKREAPTPFCFYKQNCAKREEVGLILYTLNQQSRDILGTAILGDWLFCASLFVGPRIFLNKFRQRTASMFLFRILGNEFRLAFLRVCPATNNAYRNTELWPALPKTAYRTTYKGASIDTPRDSVFAHQRCGVNLRTNAGGPHLIACVYPSNSCAVCTTLRTKGSARNFALGNAASIGSMLNRRLML